MGADRKNWWLCVDFNEVDTDGTSRISDVVNPTLKRQADSSHRHAEYRIKNHAGAFDRIDAILALKRAMQTRLDHLNQIYNFKQYPQAKDLGWLGILEEWGIIRQRMLRRMRQLRNAVEHDGAEPPTLDDCQDYCEVSWWFLRGTSPLLMPITDLAIICREGYLMFDIEYAPVRIFINGRIVPEALSDSEIDGWVPMHTFPDTWGEHKGKITPFEESRKGRYRLISEVSDSSSVRPFLQMAFMELL